MTLVTRKRPFVPDWANTLRSVIKGRRNAQKTDAVYGYRINVGDVHRKYMRFFQGGLIDMTVTLQFDDGSILLKETVEDLECTPREYGTPPFIASSERSYDEFSCLQTLCPRPKNAPSVFKGTFRDCNTDRAMGSRFGKSFVVADCWRLGWRCVPGWTYYVAAGTKARNIPADGGCHRLRLGFLASYGVVSQYH
ncbi:hypothetical protein BJX61DRAFT_398210 [Aspergillus egyptiacus]|nr:hypothetical protein BJX61DRAFT_398210 [Aspergillus egyptiacus]